LENVIRSVPDPSWNAREANEWWNGEQKWCKTNDETNGETDGNSGILEKQSSRWEMNQFCPLSLSLSLARAGHQRAIAVENLLRELRTNGNENL